MKQTPQYLLTRQDIENVPWHKANPLAINYGSKIGAREYGLTFRTILEHPKYADNKALLAVAAEELDTDNLIYDDYSAKADHWKFLDHFVQKNEKLRAFSELEHIQKAEQKYLDAIAALPIEVLVLSIVSREQKDGLTPIFQKIKASHNWREEGLSAFEYYMDAHIEIDSKDGGHGDMLAELLIELKEFIPQLDEFYKHRHVLYLEILGSCAYSSALSSIDVWIVQTDFDQSVIKPQLGLTAMEMFTGELTGLCPFLLENFANTDMPAHHKKLLTTLMYAIPSLSVHPDEVIKTLLSLGAKHGTLGIQRVHYYYVIVAMLITLRKAEGTAWTKVKENSWFKVLELVCIKMQEGSGL